MSYPRSRIGKEAPLDEQELATVLENHNLAGLVDVSRLLIADRSLQTYQDLIAVLSTKNEFGNFQFETGNISLAHSIMGGSPSGMDHPQAYNLVVSGEIIEDMLPVIADLQEETARRMEELVLEEDGPQEPEEAAKPLYTKRAA